MKKPPEEPKARIPIIILDRLKKYANQITTEYNGAVILVGSALRKEDCRDYDLRVLIHDSEFESLFRISVEQWHLEQISGDFSLDSWNYVRDMHKQCFLARKVLGMRVDIKVFPYEPWLKVHGRHPYVRIDSNPFFKLEPYRGDKA